MMLSDPAQPVLPDQLARLARADIERIQLAKLRAMLAELRGKNRFYDAKFAAAQLDPLSLGSIADLSLLPFTTKDELSADQEANPPYGSILTYPLARYVRLHQSSGTRGGRPLRWLDTPESWDWLMRLWETIFWAAGVRPDDRFFFPFSFGPFLGFWAGFDAAVRTGHLALPGGGLASAARLRFMLDNAATVVCCTPTYALHLAEVAEKEGMNLALSPIRILIVAGEPGGSIPEVKAKIESAWGARCIDHSGMTEIGSLGFEFAARPGFLYMIETECVAEIVDPASGEPASRGERGELILTNLGRWGSPLLRYRTGDIVRASAEPCPLGSSLVALEGGILARADDMVQIRGNNVYPAALEAVLRRFPELAEWRAEALSREGLAVLRLTIECAPGLESNGPALAERVAASVKESLSFRPEVEVAAPGQLPRFEMKASRFSIHSSFRKERS